jgi:hypothetical protein
MQFVAHPDESGREMFEHALVRRPGKTTCHRPASRSRRRRGATETRATKLACAASSCGSLGRERGDGGTTTRWALRRRSRRAPPATRPVSALAPRVAIEPLSREDRHVPAEGPRSCSVSSPSSRSSRTREIRPPSFPDERGAAEAREALRWLSHRVPGADGFGERAVGKWSRVSRRGFVRDFRSPEPRTAARSLDANP